MNPVKRALTLAALLSALLLVLVPVQAQDAGDGRGVVRLSASNLPAALYPPNCTDEVCRMLQTLFYPRLFDVDPNTGALLTANESDRAVVAAVTGELPANEVTLALTQGRWWDDGQPVTAYDVLFSLLSDARQATSQPMPDVVGARVIDEHTIALRFTLTEQEIEQLPPDAQAPTPTCAALPRANIFLLPSHQLSPEFRGFVDASAPPGDIPSLAAWQKAYEDARLPFGYTLPEEILTSGSYHFSGYDSENNARFVPNDGSGAALENTAIRFSPLNALLAGDTNVLLSVFPSQRDTLRTLADANARNFQIAELPGQSALVIAFNFADPQRPLPAFHPETGEPVEQGQHRIFTDVRVRRALQLAVNTAPLIDGVWQQSATPVSGLLPPVSWAFDSSLAPLATHMNEAKRLLDEAGWRQRGDTRRCVGCATADDDTLLQFTLMSNGNNEIVDALIAQWRELGVSVFAAGADVYALTGQSFDAYLFEVGSGAYEAADPDRSLMLTPAGDTLEPSSELYAPFLNYGSYNNPEVTALVDRARSLPGCDPQARAALYHELERIIQTDLPYLSLVSPNAFYVAAPNVLGFAPRSGDALWNLESWVVSP
jgi:ABC-type transport system substrate-binding protein